MHIPTRAYIALGSNLTSGLGDPRSHIQAALDALARLDRSHLRAASTIIETDPIGPQDQPRYLNAVVAIDTTLEPRDLLDRLLEIERSRGRDRTREQRWGPRTLDLDLLLYGDLQIQEPGLIVPHPRLAERLFVLAPLEELAPDLVVPGLGQTVGQLAARRRSAL
ncbi:MAG: 2-amino-4-hydroxy-6-hydroxymethyldihydropteridine diphosphokinase [Phycisphaerales bacterium]|nr:2-amino-4-hydroxy-6-hydroxymethyldihydropteridine diphosphokinase [Phycisphaerales bacterium]